MALIRALPALEKMSLEGDEQLGVNIVKRALEEPMRIIAQNAGYDASVVVNRVKTEPKNNGFDAKNGTYVDMVAEGIIDPAKVTRSALQNAASIAGLLLTTEASIYELPKAEDKGHGHAHGGAGMGGMDGMY